MFRSIRWRIAVPYMILILVAMLGLMFFVSAQVQKALVSNLETQLFSETRLLADNVRPLLAEAESASKLDELAGRWSDLLDARVTIIGLDGTVLGESHADRSEMDNHLNRPEIQQALAKGQGNSIRYSQTVGYEMMYAAFSVVNSETEQTLGFVRVSLPMKQIETSVGYLRNTIMLTGLLTLLLVVPLSVFIAGRTAHPVRRLTQVAERMAEGDLSARILPSSRDEVGQLTLTFNYMADQLREKVSTLAEERARLVVVLEHMADGVLITDAMGRVQLINPAAARMLGTTQKAALGRSFVQVVRDHQLIEVWESCCGQNEETAAMELDRLGLFLQVIVTPLRDADPQSRLVILQDLTRLQRLETVRRDFISNISHELRTPLASLKALVDTLRDGALDDPPAAQRFLDRIETEVDALTQMVRELLELSRIESGQVPLRLAPTAVFEVVLPPTERLRPQAERAGLRLDVELASDLPRVLADAERAQQVVTNLVHNAIKFTPKGGEVTVRAYVGQNDRRPPTAHRTASVVVIEVCDTGVGIPADDLARIFERFYKADRARSGGGTGLGLAISRHIVQGHGGHIWVESVPGKGSTFYFSLLGI